MKQILLAFFILISSVASASEIELECDVVAIVFDTKICKNDIEEKIGRHKEDYSEDELFKREKNKLAFKVRSIGIENLLDKESYTYKQEDIDAYIAFKGKIDVNRIKWHKKIVHTIKDLLKTYEYKENDRIRLEKGLKSFEYSLKEKERGEKRNDVFYSDIEKRFGKEAAVKMRKQLEERKDSHRIIKTMIINWKTNKALFDRYGGRVIFQQFGIEPIDAYQALIEDIRVKGKLQIIKPEYGDIFAYQEAYNKSDNHTFIPEDSFSKPYWEEEQTDESYQESIKHYKSIPHK